MNKKLLLLVVTALLSTAGAFGQSNLEKFKQEAKQEQSVAKCPLTEKQELAVYNWFKDNLNDFDSLEILNWGPYSEKSPSENLIYVRVRSTIPAGGKRISVACFGFNKDGSFKDGDILSRSIMELAGAKLLETEFGIK